MNPHLKNAIKFIRENSKKMNDIRIGNVHSVNIPYVPSWQIQQPYVPNFNPVTNLIGFPVVNMPGCVEMHKDNKRHVNGIPIDKSLIENDPGEVMTLCPDGSYPSYDAVSYTHLTLPTKRIV